MTATPDSDPALGGVEIIQLRHLGIASLVEATTLAVLVLVAVPLKHLGGWPALASVMGPVHGLAFLVYLWMVVETVSAGGWTRREVARLVAVAFVPFGGIINQGFLSRKAVSLAKVPASAGGHAAR